MTRQAADPPSLRQVFEAERGSYCFTRSLKYRGRDNSTAICTKRGTKKKYRTPPMPKTPPQASLEKIYPPTSKIKPVRVNLAIFWRLRRKFSQKMIFPKKSSTERQLRRILGGNTLKKGPPFESDPNLPPTSGMGSCTIFLHPA